MSDVRANASSMLKQVKQTGRPLVLTRRGQGAAVLLDVATYQDLIEGSKSFATRTVASPTSPPVG